MQNFETPMMQQYLEIKSRYPDCILFFRLGDFYEMFLEDAKVGSSILNITLTSRDRGKDGKIPMAGVPFHAVDNYLNKLVRAGKKVAICEQIGEVTSDTKLVDRDVVRIVTPGTQLDENSLISRQNNYVASISLEKSSAGISFVDVSTGEFIVTQIKDQNVHKILVDELTRRDPAEVILSQEDYENPNLLSLIKSSCNANIFHFAEWHDYAFRPAEFVKKHFKIKSLESFGLSDNDIAVKTSAGLLAYIKHTQKDKISHISKITCYNPNDGVLLDRSAIVNLELLQTLRDQEKSGSLLEFLDQTQTGMGGRLLRKWLLNPLNSKSLIVNRQKAVQKLLKEPTKRAFIKNTLSEVNDLERLLSRITVGIGTPRDLIAITESLNISLKIKKMLFDFSSDKFAKLT